MGTSNDKKKKPKKLQLQSVKQTEININNKKKVDIDNSQPKQKSSLNNCIVEDQEDAPKPSGYICKIDFRNIKDSEASENKSSNKIYTNDNNNNDNYYTNDGLKTSKMYTNNLTPIEENENKRVIDENPYNKKISINDNGKDVSESNFFLLGENDVKLSENKINYQNENKQMKLYTNNGEEEFTPKPVNESKYQDDKKNKLPKNIEKIMSEGFIPIFVNIKNYGISKYAKCIFAKKEMTLFKVIEEYEKQIKVNLKDCFCYMNNSKLEKGKTLENLRVNPFCKIEIEIKK